MVVNRNTIRTNSWDVIYTYLQTTNAISTNNIFSSFNSQQVSSVGYPQVIIWSPEVTFGKITGRGNYTESEVVINIDVYHNSSANAKSLLDEVSAKLIAGRSTFANNHLNSMDIESGDNDSWEENKKTVHRMGLSVSFRFVGAD